MSSKKFINIRGAKAHNLKDINLKIPRDQLVVITGLSGSGKSSLAFDTIYAEGQRRYVESLSSYARQFIGIMDKPDIDYIDGLSPAISIDQKSTSRNPRSTVGTVTEIYDYLRLLYARIGQQQCIKCHKEVRRYTPEDIINFVLQLENNTKIIIMSPIARKKKTNYKSILKTFLKEGFIRARINGKIEDIASVYDKLSTKKAYSIEIVIDRIIKKIPFPINVSVIWYTPYINNEVDAMSLIIFGIIFNANLQFKNIYMKLNKKILYLRPIN